MMDQTRSIIAGGLAMLASAASAFGGTNDVANVVSNDTPTLAGSSFASTNDVSNIASNGYSVAGVVSNDTPVAMATVTNRPHITRISSELGTIQDKINLSATNFNNGANFYLYKSTNLVDWKKCSVVYSGSNPASTITKTHRESDSAYRDSSFYLLSTTNTPSFKK